MQLANGLLVNVQLVYLGVKMLLFICFLILFPYFVIVYVFKKQFFFFCTVVSCSCNYAVFPHHLINKGRLLPKINYTCIFILHSQLKHITSHFISFIH